MVGVAWRNEVPNISRELCTLNDMTCSVKFTRVSVSGEFTQLGCIFLYSKIQCSCGDLYVGMVRGVPFDTQEQEGAWTPRVKKINCPVKMSKKYKNWPTQLNCKTYIEIVMTNLKLVIIH